MGWIIGLLLLLSACGKQEQATAPQTGRFAAYAVAHDGRTGAYTLDGLSQEAADQSALEKCRRAAKNRAGCEVIGRMTQGCMAEAAGSNTQHIVSVGKGGSAPQACANAVDACTANRGINCAAVTYGCMDGRPASFCRLRKEQTQPSSQAATVAKISGAPKRKGPFGAIAVGRNGNRAGTSFAHATQAEAEAAAEETCRGTGTDVAKDCASKVWFKDACGALAVGKNGIYGTGWHNSPAGACRWAVSTCKQGGGTLCESTIYSCSPRDVWGTCDGTFQGTH
jgi:serine/threonine-protein kinase